MMATTRGLWLPWDLNQKWLRFSNRTTHQFTQFTMSITETAGQLEVRIRTVLRAHGRLNKDADLVEVSDDLYACGMTSHASVNVMLGLENAFDVEFPDHMLKRNVFSSIQSISSALGDLMTPA